MTEVKKERYSFSRLTTFLTCKYGYSLRYLEHQKGIGNAFSSYGTLLHSILERYSRGEIGLWDLTDVYEQEFKTAVPEPFPNTKFCPDMRKLYYDQGLEFLQNFGGHPGAKLLEIETEFDIDIDDWVFNGVVDLVLVEEGDKLIIEDYKSKSSFKSKAEQFEYARQLYLYAEFVKRKHGRYPDSLRFVLFRKQKQVVIPFKEKDLEEAISWARNTVAAIRECFDYTPSPDPFFCQQLCNHRDTCEYKSEDSEEKA